MLDVRSSVLCVSISAYPAEHPTVTCLTDVTTYRTRHGV